MFVLDVHGGLILARRARLGLRPIERREQPAVESALVRVRARARARVSVRALTLTLTLTLTLILS